MNQVTFFRSEKWLPCVDLELHDFAEALGSHQEASVRFAGDVDDVVVQLLVFEKFDVFYFLVSCVVEPLRGESESFPSFVEEEELVLDVC
jgi:hypothetical protein